MSTIPTPPAAGTNTGGGTTRTLERDVKVGATVIVVLLLMGLAWQIAGDVTAHLAVTYSGKLLALRLPLFLASIGLIGAGAASFIANLLGKSFRNVIFDKRNLKVAQWVIIAFAGWEAVYAYAHSELVTEEFRKSVKPYSVSIALGVIALILYAVRKGYSKSEGNVATADSASEYGARGRGKRFPLGAAVWAIVGLVLAALIVVKLLQEIDYGLSNAPERMAARGYVPRESVAAALAAIAPALPEVHTITAPPLGADGKTNWSEVIKRLPDHYTYFSEPKGMDAYLVQNAGGVVTNYSAEVKANEYKFGSLANAVTIKWWQSKRKLTPQEIAVLEEK